MKKKVLKIVSFVIQGLYTLACVVMMILSGIFRNSFGTNLAYELMDVLPAMFVWLLLIPAMPASLFLNILAFPDKEAGEGKQAGWFAWIVLSPIVYIGLWCASCIVFLSATGL